MLLEHDGVLITWSVTLKAFKMYYLLRASVPSLHRESTDVHYILIVLVYAYVHESNLASLMRCCER